MTVFIVSLVVLVIVWYLARTFTEGHPARLGRVIDLVALLFLVLIVARYFGLV